MNTQIHTPHTHTHTHKHTHTHTYTQTLQLKKDEGTDYVLRWKSKGVYNCKLNSLNTTFLHSINLSEFKMGIKFDKDHLAVEQDNYLREISNV